tara:strand:+ start:517 stop:951 length:435 start_codon:yes stop_codon:yes gene_type:complete
MIILKKTIPIFFLLLALFNCKKNNAIKPVGDSILEGKWQLVAEESDQNGALEWVKVTNVEPIYIYFRADGIQVDDKGMPFCCASNILKLNGKSISLVPLYALPINPHCANVYCFICNNNEITLSETELIFASCSVNRKKYQKVL